MRNVRSGDQWNATDMLRATNPRDADYFGSTLALISGTLVVGANGDASAKRGVGASPDSNDAFGQQLSAYGDTIVAGALSEASSSTGVNGNASDNGATEAGAAYVFH